MSATQLYDDFTPIHPARMSYEIAVALGLPTPMFSHYVEDNHAVDPYTFNPSPEQRLSSHSPFPAESPYPFEGDGYSMSATQEQSALPQTYPNAWPQTQRFERSVSPHSMWPVPEGRPSEHSSPVVPNSQISQYSIAPPASYSFNKNIWAPAETPQSVPPPPSWSLTGSLNTATGVFQQSAEHQRLRTAQACEPCRKRKAKCSGEDPCTRCMRRGLSCEYAAELKKRGKNKDARKNSGADYKAAHARRQSKSESSSDEAQEAVSPRPVVAPVQDIMISTYPAYDSFTTPSSYSRSMPSSPIHESVIPELVLPAPHTEGPMQNWHCSSLPSHLMDSFYSRYEHSVPTKYGTLVEPSMFAPVACRPLASSCSVATIAQADSSDGVSAYSGSSGIPTSPPFLDDDDLLYPDFDSRRGSDASYESQFSTQSFDHDGGYSSMWEHDLETPIGAPQKLPDQLQTLTIVKPL